eukprot:3907273-Rhodomonas_salina.4
MGVRDDVQDVSVHSEFGTARSSHPARERIATCGCCVLPCRRTSSTWQQQSLRQSTEHSTAGGDPRTLDVAHALQGGTEDATSKHSELSLAISTGWSRRNVFTGTGIAHVRTGHRALRRQADCAA